MITKKIKYILDDLDENLNQNKISFSSENAFVFHFAWQLFKEYESFIDSVDFEVSLFEGFSDGKFIDLLVCFKNNNQITKVGFEFKFPKKENKGGTDARRSIINDIKRLTWLVKKNEIDIGVFICATNDDYFIKKDGKRVALEFATHHKKCFKKGYNLPTDEKYPEPVKSLVDITFNWKYLVKEKKGLNIEPGKYSFLEPIFVL
jgi:hypothetical protein|tara:strand:+ start:792 stop:1403 length:612 start_codon:yes stop_codon:yes gene_type:complete